MQNYHSDSPNGGEPISNQNHISIRSRQHIDITGVKNVFDFDDHNVTMDTSGGAMTVEGEGLKICVLDTEKGIVSIDGRISAVIYYDNAGTEKKGFFKRLRG